MREGLVVGAPRPGPLWIPAFAGMTVGGCGVASAGGRVGGGSRLRGNDEKRGGNDDGGSGVAGGLVVEGEVPACAGTTKREAGTTMGVCGSAGELVVA